VERVFHELEKAVATFQQATGLQCVAGCGLCCKKPDVSATALEFLPFAYHLYKNGQIDLWYDKMEQNVGTSTCALFSNFLLSGSKGFCTRYAHRGLICRLFGFSAMTNKYGEQKLVTCKPIKEEKTGPYETADRFVEAGGVVPVMSNYYHRIRAIDPASGQLLMPINQAILEAIKIVLQYYAYRTPGKAG